MQTQYNKLKSTATEERDEVWRKFKFDYNSIHCVTFPSCWDFKSLHILQKVRIENSKFKNFRRCCLIIFPWIQILSIWNSHFSFNPQKSSLKSAEIFLLATYEIEEIHH